MMMIWPSRNERLRSVSEKRAEQRETSEKVQYYCTPVGRSKLSIDRLRSVSKEGRQEDTVTNDCNYINEYGYCNTTVQYNTLGVECRDYRSSIE